MIHELLLEQVTGIGVFWFELDDVLDLDYVDEDMSEEDKYQMMDDSIREELKRWGQVRGGDLSYYIKEVELNKWDEI